MQTNRRISQTGTWPVDIVEINAAGRETRSSRPEIIYRLGNQQIEYHTPTPAQPPLLSERLAPHTESPHGESPTSQQLDPPIIDVEPTPTRQPNQFMAPSAPLATPNQNPQPKLDQGNIEEENQQPPQPSPDTDMADNAVLPPPFTGKPSENQSDWFRQFTNYCQYKDLTDQKRVDLFKVLEQQPIGWKI